MCSTKKLKAHIFDEYEILSALSSKYPDSIHFYLHEDDEERDKEDYLSAQNIDELIEFLLSSTHLQMLKRFKDFPDFKCNSIDENNTFTLYIYQKYIKHVTVTFLDTNYRDIVRSRLLEKNN